MNYKTQDGPPGSPEEWRSTFRQRMGLEEAREVVRERKQTPRGILGLPAGSITRDQFKAAYRCRAKDIPPPPPQDSKRTRRALLEGVLRAGERP